MGRPPPYKVALTRAEEERGKWVDEHDCGAGGCRNPANEARCNRRPHVEADDDREVRHEEDAVPMPSAESARTDKNAAVKMNARSSNRPSGIESAKSGTEAEIPGRQDR